MKIKLGKTSKSFCSHEVDIPVGREKIKNKEHLICLMVIGAIQEKIKQNKETGSVTGDVRKGFSKEVTFEERPKEGTVSHTDSRGKNNILYFITICTIQIYHVLYNIYSISEW